MNKLKKLFSLQLILFLSSLLIICFCKNEKSFHNIVIYLLIVIILALGIFVMINSTKSYFVMFIFLVFVVLVFIRFYLMLLNFQMVSLFENKNIKLMGYVQDYHSYKKDGIIFNFKVTHKGEGKTFIPINHFCVLIKLNGTDVTYDRWETLTIEGKLKIPKDKEVNNFNYLNYLHSKGISCYINVDENNIIIIDKKISQIQILKSTTFIRKKVLLKFEKVFNKETYTFLLSIFFGDRSLLDEKTESNYRDSGMIHLLAISGFHIGFIGMIFFNILSFVLPKDLSKILSAMILFFYVLLLNSSASSMRAFLMYLFQAIYFFLGKKCGKLTPISTAGLIMIFKNPLCIFDIGFVLSFMATGGILLYTNFFDEILENLCPLKIRSSITVSLAAFIVTFLIQASLFSKIPLFSVISGLLIIPIFSYLFIFLFIMSNITIITNINFIINAIQFLIGLFNKLISYLCLIKPINTIKLPMWIPYFITLIFFSAVYLLPVVINKINRMIKINRLSKYRISK